MSLPAAARTARFGACLVTEAGGPDEPSFDELASVGVLEAERRGIDGRIVHSKRPADYARNLRACARGGAGITIAVGYAMSDALDAVAPAFPKHLFAIVDVDVATLKHRPRNVEGLLFREQQAGYLAGYAAGLWARMQHAKAVWSVGGLKIPPVDGYIAGYRFGAKKADPGLKLLNDYSQDLLTPSACKKKALDQIGDGSVVELEVAGRCGLGVLAAAHEKDVFAIGVDDDQSRLGPWVMTSALKRVDVAVADVIAKARAGKVPGNRNIEYGAGAGGVGLGAWSPDVPASIRAAVARQFELLKAGRIRDIPTTVS